RDLAEDGAQSHGTHLHEDRRVQPCAREPLRGAQRPDGRTHRLARWGACPMNPAAAVPMVLAGQTREADMTKPILTFEASVTSTATPEDVYAVLADPSTHARWAGEDASDQGFAIIELEAPRGLAKAGTTFTSVGANGKSRKMIFHDRNVVTEAIAPHRFAFET